MVIHLRTLLLSCVAAGAMALPIAAQRTFVVDANNGPGTSFTSLTAALAQARHGDVYFLRAATYPGPFATDKGIALLGETGVVLQSPTPYAALAVGNLPAGTCFEARALTLSGQGIGFQVASCAGRVHVSRLKISVPNPQTSMRIDQATEVTIGESQLFGRVVVTASTLVITGSTLAGQPAELGSTPFSNLSGQTGLTITQVTALLADCSITGGQALSGMGIALSGGDGLRADGSDVTLAGTAAGTMKLTGGYCFSGACTSFVAGRAAYLVDSQMRYAPNVVLSAQFTPLSLAGSSQATVEPLPALIATGGARGGSISTTLASSAGDPLALVLGPPADPVVLPLGVVAVSFNPFVVLAQGAQAPTGVTSLTLPVPNNPQLAGHALALQAATLDLASGRSFFSNPAIVVID